MGKQETPGKEGITTLNRRQNSNLYNFLEDHFRDIESYRRGLLQNFADSTVGRLFIWKHELCGLIEI
jgi:hypothetical protein